MCNLYIMPVCARRIPVKFIAAVVVVFIESNLPATATAPYTGVLLTGCVYWWVEARYSSSCSSSSVHTASCVSKDTLLHCTIRKHCRINPPPRSAPVLLDDDIADSEPVWRLILDHISLWWGEGHSKDHMPEGFDIASTESRVRKLISSLIMAIPSNYLLCNQHMVCQAFWGSFDNPYYHCERKYFSRVEYSLDYFRRDQIQAEIAEGVEINEGERKSKAKRAGNKKSELWRCASILLSMLIHQMPKQ